MRNDYYVYFHRNSITNEIFYVGKGRNKRAFDSNNRRSLAWKNYLSQNNCGFIVEIVESNLTNEQALDVENKYLTSLRGLVNVHLNATNVEDLLSICDNFEYSKNSPTFLFWKTPMKRGKSKAGDIAGCFDRDGYIKITYNYRSIQAHRLVWVMFNGCEIPSGMVINHIDCNRFNNSISNLECVSVEENNQRRKYHIDSSVVSSVNSSGLNGVRRCTSSPNKRNKQEYSNWQAMWYEDGVYKYRAFSVIKYGEDVAKQLAIEWRKAKEIINFDSNRSNILTEEFNLKYAHLFKRDLPSNVFIQNNGKTVVADIKINKVRYTKRFYLNEYALEDAVNLATEWLENVKKDLKCIKPRQKILQK